MPDDELPAKKVNLALQGGGSHGAFGWGVLDRLLEDGRIAVEGISATSAGSMNAVVFAYGLAVGGREGARASLTEFWTRISEVGCLYSPLKPSPLDQWLKNPNRDAHPAYMFFDTLTRAFSPYQLNPLNLNPLRDVLEKTVDFERLRKACPVKLFLCATNVLTGKVKIFDNSEMSSDAVLASGCLPFLFQAIEIGGEAYWDGGYMGNPAIFPLIYGCEAPDVIIVHINPINRSHVPRTSSDILNRLNEISFNSSLMREMRAIAFVTRLIDDKKVQGDDLRRVFIHDIEDESYMRALGSASKLDPDWDFLCALRDHGSTVADAWLARNFDRVGKESTVDIRAKYL
jgi:NTE family protein